MELSTIIYLTLGCLTILAISKLLPLDIWITAKFASVDLPLGKILFMRFRGLNPNKIGSALILAGKGGVDLSLSELEVYELAKGDSIKLVRAFIIAKREEIPLTMQEVSKALENKIDIEQLVREAAKRKNE